MHKGMIRKDIVREYVWVDEKGVMTTMVERIAEETEVYSCVTDSQESDRVNHKARSEQERLLTWFKRGIKGLRWLAELVLKSIINDLVLLRIIGFFIR